MAPSHICCIVPPHLLRAIAESQSCSEDHRTCAHDTLTQRNVFTNARRERFAALAQPRGSRHQAAPRQGIVPEHILKHICEADDVDEGTKARARSQLDDLQKAIGSYKTQQGVLLAKGETQATLASKKKPDADGFWRAVYDAGHSSVESKLPGKVVRTEGQKASKDTAVNEAYDNVGNVLDFYLSVFNWKSIDNQNMHVVSSVHFGKDYENACKWSDVSTPY
jgi:Zn-dependent metalloprotease